MDERFSAPLAAAAALRGWPHTWCIAGGWAIDLLGREVSRDHDDVEVAVLRQDQHALRQQLGDWVFAKVARPGELSPWEADETLSLPIHEVHATSPSGQALEVLLNEAGDGEWLFRRDTSVRRDLARWTRRGLRGVPVLAPEIVLLYKAKAPRPKDELDFVTALDALGHEPRDWLIEALMRAYPESPWLQVLRLRSSE